MVHVYKTKGTCSKEITVEVDENGVIQNCSFKGGCPGNLLGISKIVVGMKAEEVIKTFRGNPCGFRKTSCPDQLSYALEEALAANTVAAAN